MSMDADHHPIRLLTRISHFSYQLVEIALVGLSTHTNIFTHDVLGTSPTKCPILIVVPTALAHVGTRRPLQLREGVVSFLGDRIGCRVAERVDTRSTANVTTLSSGDNRIRKGGGNRDERHTPFGSIEIARPASHRQVLPRP